MFREFAEEKIDVTIPYSGVIRAIKVEGMVKILEINLSMLSKFGLAYTRFPFEKFHEHDLNQVENGSTSID
jgi:hypothetical protein